MTTYTEPARAPEFLLSEYPGTISREKVTILTGAAVVIKPGDVLGKITDGGKYALYVNAAEDGTEVADAIAYQGCDATAADQEITVITRLAEVKSALLTWEATNDAAAKTAGLADLAVKHLIAR